MSRIVRLPLTLSFGQTKWSGIPSLPVEAIMYIFIESGKFEEVLRDGLGLDVRIESSSDGFVLVLRATEEEVLEVRKALANIQSQPSGTARMHVRIGASGATVTISAGMLYYLQNLIKIFGKYTPSALLIAAGYLKRILGAEIHLHVLSLIEALAEKELYGNLISVSQFNLDEIEERPELTIEKGSVTLSALRRRLAKGKSFAYETGGAVYLYMPMVAGGKTIWCLCLVKRPAPQAVRTLQLLAGIATIFASYMPSMLPKLASILSKCRDESWGESCRLLADILSLVVMTIEPSR